jgi:hypothetical protein
MLSDLGAARPLRADIIGAYKGDETMTNTNDNNTRVGDRMAEAAAYVADHPGCAILPVAEYVGPHGSRRYGYATVHRAIKAGIINAVRGSNGRYTLTAAE